MSDRFAIARFRVLRVETLVVSGHVCVCCALLVISLHISHYKNKTVKSGTVIMHDPLQNIKATFIKRRNQLQVDTDSARVCKC